MIIGLRAHLLSRSRMQDQFLELFIYLYLSSLESFIRVLVHLCKISFRIKYHFHIKYHFMLNVVSC